MTRLRLIALGLVAWIALGHLAQAQVRPYIGFVYPAGGQQGTTFQIRLGGQNMDDVNRVLVSGSGVTARVFEYCRRLNNQEVQLLNEQVKELKRATSGVASATASSVSSSNVANANLATNESRSNLIAKIERRTREQVQTPACASIATLTIVEVTIAPDAEPGEREIRLGTGRGISNPLAFHVGQVPEFSRKPMLTATIQILGKEAQALRKRPADEAEDRVTIPCTLNGQIASGEINRYRFEARKGQRLLISTLGRQLIPYIADAVPGWFQPVLVLYDAHGKEVAYDDDYQFRPDPIILYEVPKDGEYTLAIHDSIYRGREDFVYRITVGELPFITSIFPLGGRAGQAGTIKMKGWNLEEAQLSLPSESAGPGVQQLAARHKDLVSNRMPFAVDTLPESFEKEPNNDLAHAQKVGLPVIINGHVDKPDDWDVFQFAGHSNELIVAEVIARRLDSPLDSVIKLTDAKGTLLAFNDDHEDVASGLNTHHADSYLMVKLPADGNYFLHLGDTARKGGEEHAYRLRLSAPRPDFVLRVSPSSIGLRGKNNNTLTVYALREDGFSGPIKLALKDPPPGFSTFPVTLSGTQAVARLTIKSEVIAIPEPVNLTVVGSAKLGETELVHEAVPAEDRMQAFLWRHLVPATDLKALVFDPAYEAPRRRVAPVIASSPTNTAAANTTTSGTATNTFLASKAGATNAPLASITSGGKPQFTRQQIAGRMRQLRMLYEDGLITEEFYIVKVAECEAAQ